MPESVCFDEFFKIDFNPKSKGTSAVPIAAALGNIKNKKLKPEDKAELAMPIRAALGIIKN